MENEVQEPELDCVDQELDKLIDEVVGDSDSEEDFDEATSILMDVMAYLIDEGTIEDPPEDDATEEQKQEWISKHMPTIRSAMKEALVDSSMG